MSAELALLIKLSNDISNLSGGGVDAPDLSQDNITMNQGGFTPLIINNYFDSVIYQATSNDEDVATVSIKGNTVYVYGGNVIEDSNTTITVSATVPGFAPSLTQVPISIFHVPVASDEAISIANFSEAIRNNRGWRI